MRWVLLATGVGLLALGGAGRARAQAPSLENAAARLQAATLTLRVAMPHAEGREAAPPAAASPPRVEVFSAVSLGDGLLVAPLNAVGESHARVTLPDGGQAEARPVVIDQYSGLALLALQPSLPSDTKPSDTKPSDSKSTDGKSTDGKSTDGRFSDGKSSDGKDVAGGENGGDRAAPQPATQTAPALLPALPLAAADPRVGSWALSAAAWGAEKPLVSVGVVSGVERAPPSANYPPLLVCDLRTADTSTGAGVVNADGELLGVVVAIDASDGNRRGWTYAVPARHVQRLLRTLAAHREARADAARSGDVQAVSAAVIVLQRRRPIVGMVLGDSAEAVVVKRVEPGSPAEKAGFRVGDEILEVDGVKIRSVYQAVRPVLAKQPGDTMAYVVRQGEVARAMSLTLAGGTVMPAVELGLLSGLTQPKVMVGGPLEPAPVKNAEVGAGEAEPPRADVVALLEKALDRYRSAIVFQQGQFARSEQERHRLEKELQTLKAEIDALRGRLEAPRR